MAAIRDSAPGQGVEVVLETARSGMGGQGKLSFASRDFPEIEHAHGHWHCASVYPISNESVAAIHRVAAIRNFSPASRGADPFARVPAWVPPSCRLQAIFLKLLTPMGTGTERTCTEYQRNRWSRGSRVDRNTPRWAHFSKFAGKPILVGMCATEHNFANTRRIPFKLGTLAHDTKDIHFPTRCVPLGDQRVGSVGSRVVQRPLGVISQNLQVNRY